ncbi:PH domain-containing protein [Nocardioides sp. ChNu-99]|uniref:PH domain-containing protein n=1 Tax=Nocardioides sp. ChNu-99 TaxID=2839897 RepID=UPI0024067AEB|nr:PH domain-containing protein [Nocardioides sp. ChNu-99]MDF9716819.1 PH domain-containing protein [Nocardioides sp. ChNu-99]
MSELHPPPYDRPVDPDDGWTRLDKRMLVIGPVRVLGQFAFPLLLGFIGIGTQMGPWALLFVPIAVVAACVLGAIPWLTTYYRQTATHFEVRRGLLNRTNQTAPLDRVRSVDQTASLLHRVLGVTKVEIGTGVDDSRITLDVVTAPEAHRLQVALLPRTAGGAGPAPTPAVGGGEAAADASPDPPEAVPGSPVGVPGPGAEQVLATLRWSWLRFAPLSLARLAIVAGAFGAGSQFFDDLPVFDTEHASALWDWLGRQFLPLLLLVVAVVLLVLWLVISLTGYVVQWAGFRLVRQPGGRRPGDTSLHLRAGLLTTRSVTVEERRVRGVELVEPALMRFADGAELSTLATGVENGTTKVLPSCPLDVAVAVGHDVLGPDAAAAAPLTTPLVAHGPGARRRAHVRWQWSTLIFGTAALAALLVDGTPAWAPVPVVVFFAVLGVAGAESSYRNLGHALTTLDGRPRHLVAGSGAFARTRTVLEAEGVIGWVVEQSFFQRRTGLADLVATTAAGGESMRVRDVDLGVGLRLADAATPGLLTPFRVAPARAT